MLKTEKSITLSGQVLIDLSANVSDTNGSANVTKTITNAELYEANKTQCRADFKEFSDKVYAIEDSIMTE